ncbi:helix-turn-helix domain-containing protein [Cellulosimicrobium funkei]|uniref:helix-turn-helix domain-containing protein n=1 Tax=Cellulosimicrobium funkei TaxID=264251 RepID=UPI0036AB5AF8
MRDRSLTLAELSRRTGITMANLSKLKANKARSMRLSTISRLCAELGITPGDLLVLRDEPHVRKEP